MRQYLQVKETVIFKKCWHFNFIFNAITNIAKKKITIEIAIKNGDDSETYFNGSETKSWIIPYGAKSKVLINGNGCVTKYNSPGPLPDKALSEANNLMIPTYVKEINKFKPNKIELNFLTDLSW